jgi:hypothetical protein
LTVVAKLRGHEEEPRLENHLPFRACGLGIVMPHALTPSTVGSIATRGALFLRGRPVQDPVLAGFGDSSCGMRV